MRLYLLALSLAACGGGGSSSIDAAVDAPPNDGRINADDGTPTRVACTSNFGTKLSANPTFGRLDGYLVAIVPPGGSACNADSDHVHLQVRMNGAVYDVAVDATNGVTHVDDVHTGTMDLPMPSSMPWTEGWHTGVGVDYPILGVHSTDIPLMTKSQIVSALQTDLASANHISIYATTYGTDGAHLVHRNGGAHDGVIVTKPLSNPSHLRFLSFSDQTF